MPRARVAPVVSCRGVAGLIVGSVAVVRGWVGDADPPRNLRLAELWAPDTAFREDPFRIEARLDAERVAGRELTVELSARAAR